MQLFQFVNELLKLAFYKENLIFLDLPGHPFKQHGLALCDFYDVGLFFRGVAVFVHREVPRDAWETLWAVQNLKGSGGVLGGFQSMGA